MYYTP